MNRLQERVLLSGSAVAAAILAWLLYPRHTLAEDAPAFAGVLLELISWIVWLAVLLPVWLPAVIPARLKKPKRIVAMLSGMMLLVAIAGWLYSVLSDGGRPSLTNVLVATGIAFVAALHLSSGTPS